MSGTPQQTPAVKITPATPTTEIASTPSGTPSAPSTTSNSPEPGQPPASSTATPESNPELSFVDSLIENFDREDTVPEELVPAPVQEPVVTAPQPQAAPEPPQPPGVTPPVVQPQAPATAQPQAPAAQPGQQPQPAAQPVTPPAQQPAVAPPGQTQPQQVEPGQELAALRAAMEAQRENFVNTAAQSYLPTFSDQDVEAIQGADMGAAKQSLARMAARLHADIAQNILGMMAQQVPVMVARMQTVHTQHQQATEQFYSQYPDLRQHQTQVQQIAAGLRQAYPQMPTEQFIPLVVATARQMAGVAPAPGVTPPVQQQPQQRVIQQAPFQPAPARSSAPAPRAPAANNQWSFMSEILDAEDKGAFEPR